MKAYLLGNFQKLYSKRKTQNKTKYYSSKTIISWLKITDVSLANFCDGKYKLQVT